MCSTHWKVHGGRNVKKERECGISVYSSRSYIFNNIYWLANRLQYNYELSKGGFNGA